MQQGVRVYTAHCQVARTCSAVSALCSQAKRCRHSHTGAFINTTPRWQALPMAVNSSIISTSAVHQSDSQQAEGITAEDLVQYVVLRKDLWTEKQWPLGSIIAQGCHASTAALWLSRDSPATKAYCAPDKLDSMHKVCLLTTCLPGIAHGSDSKTGLALKVVLEVKGEPQLQTLSQRLSENGVEHKLWMEQPENIATCLATVPAGKSSIQQHFKKYQLCKGN